MGNCLAAEYVNKSGNKCCREGLRANCNPLPERVRGTGSAGANILLVEEAPNSNPHAKYKRGAVTRSPLVRLESELLQVFQNSIKQLQCCNNEFEDKNGDIHQAHTRLLWFRSTAS